MKLSVVQWLVVLAAFAASIGIKDLLPFIGVYISRLTAIRTVGLL